MVGSSNDAEKRRPRLLFLVQIITDADLLAPLIVAARGDPRLQVHVIVTHAALTKTPELEPLLRRLGLDWEPVREDEILREQVPDLTEIDAVISATESTAPAHRIAHALARRANRSGVHTFTMQHGFENVGLTYFDREYPSNAVRFASRTIFTWGPSERLHPAALHDTRARCRPLGCSKPAQPTLSVPPRPDGRERLVAIFENLHWSRYSDAYRESFLAAIELVAQAHPDTTFFIKPHPAGKWLTARYHGPRPTRDNILIAVPGDPRWELYDAAATIELADGVITTPSTVALDAARRQRPTAVVAAELALEAYAPLPLLRSGKDWGRFVAGLTVGSLHTEFVRQSECFAASAFVPGDAAARILDHVVATVARGPALPSTDETIVFHGPPRRRRGLRRVLEILRGGAPPSALRKMPHYLAEPGSYTLSANAEATLHTAMATLRAQHPKTAPWPTAVIWDDAVIALNWRKTRLRAFGIRRTLAARELLAQLDLRLAGAVREDVLFELARSQRIAHVEDTSGALRHLLRESPETVLPVEGIWRFVGPVFERRAIVAPEIVPARAAPARPAAPPRARSIGVIVSDRDLAPITIECLESLAAQETATPLEVVLVHPTSESEARRRVVDATRRLAARHTGLRFQLLGCAEPHHHSRQLNLAATKLQSDVLVFVDGRVRLLSGNLLQRLADHCLLPRVATVGPRIVGRGGRLVCAGLTVSHLPRPGSDQKELLVRELESEAFADLVRETVGSSFVCAAVARTVWEASGGLDAERFPFHYHDVDLCLRLLGRGLRHLYVGDVQAFHQPGANDAQKQAELRVLHDAVLARHDGGHFDRIAPDCYELPAATTFPGEEGERWGLLLRLAREALTWGKRQVQPATTAKESRTRATPAFRALARLRATVEQKPKAPALPISRATWTAEQRESLQLVIELVQTFHAERANPQERAALERLLLDVQRALHSGPGSNGVAATASG